MAALVAAFAILPWPGIVHAQDDTEAAPTAPKPARPKRPPHPAVKSQRAPKARQAQPAPAATSPPPAAPSPAPAQPQAVPAVPGPPAATTTFTGQLQQAGTRTCAPLVEQLAGASMQGVTNFNILSHWMTGGADSRAVSLLVGQQYGGNATLPSGLTSVFAAPSGPGKCDAMSMQVVPSPLPCAKLRDTIAQRGRQIGDLAGVLVMEDTSGQTLLVPTGAGTCVLVGTRITYAK